ncbi:MAG: hypothetical protein GY797_38775 [Deltaproteobacteria bacterium]|nr:hypothetical protein [Deltaproteobacteria bacterium]
MSLFIGTAYFNSKIEAVRYYAKQDTDKQSVETYIKEGLIYIGLPKGVSKHDLSLDDDGRYWRKENG